MEAHQSAIQALRYLSPLAVAICAAATSVVEACRVVPAQHARQSHRARPIVLLRLVVALLVLCYIAEVVALFTEALQQPEHQPPHAHVVQVAVLFLVWVVIGFTDRAPWHTYLGSAVLGLALELPLLILVAPQELRGTAGTVHFGLQCTRLFLLAAVAVVTAAQALRHYVTTISHEAAEAEAEAEPLLSGTTENGTTENGTQDNSDSEVEEERDAYVKKQQKRRLEEAGSWWKYLQTFSVFLPYLIPKNDRKVQLCMLVTVLCLLARRALNVLLPRQLGIITNSLVAGGRPIAELGWWLVLTAIDGSSGLGLLESLISIPIDQFSYRQVTNAAFGHVMGLSIDFHNDQDSAELMKAIEQGQSLNTLLNTFVQTIGPTLIDLVVGVVYFYQLFDLYVCLVVLLAALTFVTLDVKTSNWNFDNRRRLVKAVREESRVMHQAVQGWQTVSYFNQFEHERAQFAGALAAYQKASRVYQRRAAYTYAFREVIPPLTFFGVGVLIILRISHGQASPGDFVFFLQYWGILMSPLKYLSQHYRWLMQDLIDAERLLLLLQTKPTVTDKAGAGPLRVSKGNVQFTGVSFSYDPRKTTLDRIDLEAKRGSTVALVGETGGGKSTILKLIYRFYDVSAGQIEIDGQDIRDVTLDSLRNALGVVPQDPTLFNTTIMENVRYARLDASDEEVHDVCRAAAVHDKIMTFPDQYQSKVGNRGVKLSGGELQRVAIARVLLKNPPIVLLDEATSAIDTATEASIQAAFQKLVRGRTTFVIAHRLSTIRNADQIAVIKEGRIIERGTHHALLQLRGTYHGLWSKQVANESGETAGPGDAPTTPT
ncbi:MAG: hypothetical protein M1838_004586 [Thelocarpon superellum]|nr:MAG: hypothetical protein M1838_004586 [Thelocarpon superellum]